MAITCSKAIKKARTELHELTGLEISSTIGAVQDDDGWKITLEAIEKKSIPDSMDILAIYETKMNSDGDLIEFNRIKMRKRIDTDEMDI
ncbi:MAG: Gas vesicle synthesis family protein [Candidatus Magnetoglobus multicellularis str. Araruama]|uniref:Gas vesicle synthesis family protein n=1 Tax=Candidatus Magnetoglobus multicellularis str. Araruama TaxID=890399 RepID=A0A1V1PGT7_9BACT|nr:MAG: Gas vesicle synthesis family protein [Candidatus Magnetoglobus multicellularis str. Araruama]